MKTRYLLATIFYCFIGMILLTSYVPYLAIEDSAASKYVFYVSGNITAKINGQMCFDAINKTNNRGENYTTLEFTLADTKKHILGLQVVEGSEIETLEQRSYVVKNNSGSDDNVFGYLNMVDSDDLPYYTEQGEITILSFSDNICKGHLNLILKNNNGKKIQVSGDFTADSLR